MSSYCVKTCLNSKYTQINWLFVGINCQNRYIVVFGAIKSRYFVFLSNFDIKRRQLWRQMTSYCVKTCLNRKNTERNWLFGGIACQNQYIVVFRAKKYLDFLFLQLFWDEMTSIMMLHVVIFCENVSDSWKYPQKSVIWGL